MSSTNKHLPKLHQCLHDELTAMSSLSEVLKLEEGALIDGNVEKLNKLTIEKMVAINTSNNTKTKTFVDRRKSKILEAQYTD